MFEPGYPVSSVGRALTIVSWLHERGTMRVQEVANEFGVAPSTAHRLLAMLRHHGFAVQDGQHAYHPGPVLMALRSSPAGKLDLLHVAHPHLQGLAHATEETVHLMVLEGAGARFVDGVDGTQALRVGSRVGMVLPAHVTSGGKVLLAALSEDELHDLYPGGLPPTRRVPKPDFPTLRQELTTIRRRGFAINAEESEQGVNAVGAPVWDRSGRAIAAVVVAAPSIRIAKRDLPKLRDQLIGAAEAISKQL